MSRALISLTVRPRYAVQLAIDRVFGDDSAVRNLHDVYAGRTLFVVGNGPSLNYTPLDSIAGFPSIGMNKIDMIFDRTSWRPDMIVCTNSVVVRQHRENFTGSNIPIFLPTKARSMLGGKALNSGGFFSLTPSRDFSINLLRGVGRGDTVTYAALQFAYWMGATTVVLLGVDHSYGTSQDDARKYKRRQGDDNDHFDPNYFKNGQLWGIPDLKMSEMLYKKARNAFEADGRKVFDATVGGKLRVFERIDLDNALSLAGS